MNTVVAPSLDFVIVCVVAVTGTLFVLMPDLTRPSLYFAVTVAPDFRRSADARRARSIYRTAVISASLACLALLFVVRPSEHPTAGSAIPLLLIGAVLAAFVAARRIVLPHSQAPVAVRDAGVLARRSVLPGGLLLRCLPFAILSVAAIVLAARWEQLPQRFPVHWGADGTPDVWAARTIADVFEPLITGAVVCGLLLLVAWGIARGARRLAVTGPEADRENSFRRFMLWVLLGSQIFIAGVAGLFALLPVLAPRISGSAPAAVGGLTIAGLAVLTFWILRFGQGGSRPGQMAGDGRTASESIGDRSADACWKVGIFYFNPQDSALFVEKRFGIGYTVNFGNPLAWVLVTLVLVVPALVAYLLR